VAIVGAGPYGLSVAAHLRTVPGLEIKIFGEPMSFWERHMPAGMLLRSPHAATHLSDPQRRLTLDVYQTARGCITTPVPLDVFVDYGRWFQRRVAPDLDQRTVTRVAFDSGGFRLTLQDGETCKARRVIVACGIGTFARRPRQFRGVSDRMVSHTSEHRDLSRFAGKEVLVVGGGQSALESAALIREAGGDVEVAIRSRVVRWLHQRPWMHRHLIGRVLYAPPDVGPAGVSQLVARPNLFRQLPRKLQDQLGLRSIRPAGAAWLKPRCQNIRVRVGCRVTSVTTAGDRVRVALSDGTERLFNHVLLGTGYQVDISRYPFLSPTLLTSVRRTNGYPELDAGFECSAPGLHFVGAPAAWSFGPLMRFVAGAEFTARSVRDRIARALLHGFASSHSHCSDEAQKPILEAP